MKNFAGQPGCRVVAVCDVSEAKQQKAKEIVDATYSDSGCAMIADWRDRIARKDIDAVMISTPDHCYAVMCLAALGAGKDVACEKPLTRNIAEGRKIVQAVAANQRVFCTDSEFRSYRMCHHAAQLVRNGKIGKLQRIITGHSQGLQPGAAAGNGGAAGIGVP